MRSQADQCLASGAKVILMTSLDPGSGCAIIAAATARKVRTIDYDRLNTGCKGANYYVSFNNPVVGRLMGQGVKAAMTAKGLLGPGKKPVIAYLNGGPTDNNSKLFKGPPQGYAGVLDPLIKSGKATKGPDQGVPAWDNQKARTIFEQMLVSTSNKIDAVAAANDGLANAVVTALKAKKLKPIPLSGQDATAQGAQNIISGWQSGTVYKPAKIEAPAAATLAIALIKGGSAEGQREDEQRRAERAVGARDPDLDHEEEHQPAVHGRPAQEVRGLRRLVQAVLLGNTNRVGEAARPLPPPARTGVQRVSAVTALPTAERTATPVLETRGVSKQLRRRWRRSTTSTSRCAPVR